jgi:antitoxin component HigA of HigAB toxin-antitoxin module
MFSSLSLGLADSFDGELLDVLSTLVQAYESKHYPIDPPGYA